MKKLITAFLFLPGAVFAQNFKGRVSCEDGKPVIGAQLSLLKADSSVLASAYSDSSGAYVIVYSANDAELLKAAADGYLPVYTNASAGREQMLTLQEANAQQLKEVSIVARKPLIEFKADRTIFNVENSISAAGGDAVDAIKRAPGTQVTHGQISLAGKSSVAVMINGRLQQVSGDDLMQLLHSISADNISKIEIITSPSAKYDAEGNSGIINLILKKNKQQGFRGNAGVSQEYNMGSYFPTANLALYHQQNKLNLAANINGGKQGYPYHAYIDNYFPGQRWHQDIAYPYINPYARVQFSGDYACSKKSTLGFTVAEAFSVLDNKERITAKALAENGETDSTVTTSGHTTDRYMGKLTLNTNYEYRIDSNGKKMNIDLDFYRQKGNRLRHVTKQNILPDGSFGAQQTSRVSGEPLTKIMSAKVDFVLPYAAFRLNFGGKLSRSENELDNRYEQKLGDDYVNDTLQTNRFLYAEDIYAAYVTANRSFQKWEFTGGLRWEHTRGVGTLANTGHQTVRDYHNLFPTASAVYKLNEHQNFNVSFARRISRPNYSFLNPFRFYYSPNTYTEGNPALQPSFNYVTKLGYSFKSLLNVALFYNHISNYFDRVYNIDTTLKTSVASRQNLGSKQIVAIETDISLQPASCWELMGSINGGYVRFLGAAGTGNSAQFSGFNWWVDMTNNFYLNRKRTLAAELSAFYYSPRQRDYVYWAAMKSVSLALRCMLLQKKLTITFAAEDIFATSYWLQTNQLNQTKEYSYDGHAFRLSLSYKFGNKNVKSLQQKSLEEIQRAN